MQNSIVRQYYVLSGMLSFVGLSFVSAVYVTFLLRSGLTLGQANFVNATFYTFLVIFEIPTGAFADTFGRKWSFVVVCALLAVAKFIYGTATGISGFLFAEVVCAFALTFYTGAFDAWFNDSMKFYGNPGPYTKIFARGNFINQICAALGAISGSYLYAMHPIYPWIIGGWLLIVLTIITILIMKEPYFVRKTSRIGDAFKVMWAIVVKSFHYARTDRSFRFIIVTMFLQVMTLQALNMYWQPLFELEGFDATQFGYIFAGVKISLATGAFLLSLVTTENRERKFLLWSQILTGIFILCAALAPLGWIALIAFLLHEVVRGFFDPLRKGYLQHRITSDEERATISSFSEIGPHIGGAIGLTLSGFAADHYGIHTTWFMCGSVLIIGSMLISRMRTD